MFCVADTIICIFIMIYSYNFEFKIQKEMGNKNKFRNDSQYQPKHGLDCCNKLITPCKEHKSVPFGVVSSDGQASVLYFRPILYWHTRDTTGSTINVYHVLKLKNWISILTYWGSLYYGSNGFRVRWCEERCWENLTLIIYVIFRIK